MLQGVWYFPSPPNLKQNALLLSHMKNGSMSKITVRQTSTEDIPLLIALQKQIYPDIPPWSEGKLREQLEMFPRGQLVAEYPEGLLPVRSLLPGTTGSNPIAGKKIPAPVLSRITIPWDARCMASRCLSIQTRRDRVSDTCSTKRAAICARS